MSYLADVPIRGRVLDRQLPWSIGIIESPDKPALIGVAYTRGRTNDGLALWRLNVRGFDLPGAFITDDQRFVPFEDAQE